MLSYILSIIIIIYIFWLINYNTLTLVNSDIDEHYYFVNNLPDKKQASNTLATLRNRLKLLVDKLDGSNKYYKRLKVKFNSILFLENPLLNPKKNMTSYSVNKGDRIVLCLREANSLKLHQDNIITYVAIHELAHIACPEIGHTKLFVEIFALLLKEAIKIGIYQDQNYSNFPVNYCGIKITERII